MNTPASGIFITGAAGFIGSALATHLAAAGNEVHGLVRQPAPYLPDAVRQVTGELTDPASYQPQLRCCRTVYHGAALVSFRRDALAAAEAVNVGGTRVLLTACREAGVQTVVLLSAGAVLGVSPRPDLVLDESAQPEHAPTNVYAYTKARAEAVAGEFARAGLRVIIANISTVYGAGDRKLNSGTIIKTIAERRLPFIPPGGTSYIARDDLVAGLLLLAERGRAGERYILSAENLTYADLVRRIAAVLAVAPPRWRLPAWTAGPARLAARAGELLAQVAPGGTPLFSEQLVGELYGYKYYSAAKAATELGWRPRLTLEDAVLQAVADYRARGVLA